MMDKQRDRSPQLLFTMIGILLLVVIIGIQLWYMLDMKKQLDAIRAESVSIQSLIEGTADKGTDVAVTAQSAVSAEETVATPEQEQPVEQTAGAASSGAPPATPGSGSTTEDMQLAEATAEETANAVAPSESPAATPAEPGRQPPDWPMDDNIRQFGSPYHARPWGPNQDLRRMQREMERKIEPPYYREPPDYQYHFSQHFSLPQIDVREDARRYIVLVNTPGADEKDVSVKLEGQRLTIRGRQMQQKQDRDASGHMVFSERRSGKFQRSLTLPSAVDEKGMKTRINNGVLTIVIPKKL